MLAERNRKYAEAIECLKVQRSIAYKQKQNIWEIKQSLHPLCTQMQVDPSILDFGSSADPSENPTDKDEATLMDLHSASMPQQALKAPKQSVAQWGDLLDDLVDFEVNYLPPADSITPTGHLLDMSNAISETVHPVSTILLVWLQEFPNYLLSTHLCKLTMSLLPRFRNFETFAHNLLCF